VEKHSVGQKSHKCSDLVQKALVHDILKEKGEEDAQVELVEQEREEGEAKGEVSSTPEGSERPKATVPELGNKDHFEKMCQDLAMWELVPGGTADSMWMSTLYEKYCAFICKSKNAGKRCVTIGRPKIEDCGHRHHVHSISDVGVDPECSCEPGTFCERCGGADVYILIDQIQHFTPGEIALMLGDGEKVYSVQYEYRARRGGHHVLPGGLPEVRWQRDDHGLWVEDSMHRSRYRKSPADWTIPGGCKIGDETLAWNVVNTIGDCQILQFHLVRAAMEDVRAKDPMDDSYYGNVTPDMVGLHDPRATELEPIMSTITSIFSSGKDFYCHTQDREVLVPKQGVGHIALWAAGKRRDERSYYDASIQARQWLKTTRLSTIERADCLPYIVSFGLLRNMEAEAKAMDCLALHADAVSVHNARLSDPFMKVTETSKKVAIWASRNKWWLTPATLGATAIAAFAYGLFTKGKVQGALQQWMVVITKLLALQDERAKAKAKIAKANLLESVVAVGKQAWHYLTAAEHSSNRKFSLTCGIIAYMIMSMLLRVRTQPRVAGPLVTYCARNRPLKPMREGAKCKVDGDASALDEDCNPTEGPFHIGLGVSNHVPVLARHCIHNDLVAVRNRGICERAAPEPKWWSTTGRRRMFSLFGNLEVTETPRPEWLARYPGKMQRELDRALEDETYADAYYSGTRKAFTKSECAEKRTDPTDGEPWGEIEGYDPRLIQGCQLEYVNATGPFAHALSKSCKGEHGDTTYGPGLNALALDKWLDYAETSFDEEVAYLDSDAVRLDASVCVECINVETDLYEHLGATEEAVRMFRADTVTHGHTSKGISYSVPGTVPSGKTTTTVGNTIAVITTVEEALKDIKHKAIVAGDDAAILVPARLAKEARDALILVGKQAGFELKVKASRYRCDMEFCSGRWWSARTPYGFAFGPKPGKLLPKLFYASTRNSVGSATDAYLHAICVGMMPSVQHLPVAREFVQQVFALTDHRWGPQGGKLMKEAVKKKLDRSYKVQRALPIQESPDIWEDYAHIYGLSRGKCMRAIKELRDVEILPNLVESNVYDAMVAQDAPAVGDPEDRDPSLLSGGSVLGFLWSNLAWVSPYLEESIRRIYPRAFTTWVIAFESLAWVQMGGAPIKYLPAAVMHLGAAYLQMKGRFRSAMLLHSLFNLAVHVYNAKTVCAKPALDFSLESQLWETAAGGGRSTGSYESCVYISRENRISAGNLAAKLVDSYSPYITFEHNNHICETMSYPAKPQRQPRRRRQAAKFSKMAPSARAMAITQVGRAFNSRRPTAPRARQQRNSGQRRNPMRNAFPSGNNSRPKRTCFVENDEYIGEILGSNSTTPVIQTFPVNPGQATTFPWLSEQALQWEKYRFNYLEFYYKPEVSGFATEGQSGKVIMMMDYDASDPAPTTKQEAEDTDPHVDGMPYEDIGLKLDPYEMYTNSDSKYIRPFGLPGGSDIKTYDCGNLSVLTVSNGGTNAVGELHVRYGVTFEVPVLEATKSAAPANNQVALFQSNGGESITTTVQKQLVLATASFNGIGAVNTAGSIVLPAGNYLLDVNTAIIDTSNTTTSAVVTVQFGGNTISTVADTTAAATLGDVDIASPPMFVQSTGGASSAITVLVQVTGGGTLTATGVLRAVSV